MGILPFREKGGIIPSNKKQPVMMITLFLFILVFGQELPFQPDILKPPELKVVRDWKFEKPIKDFALGTIVRDKDTIVYPKLIVFNDEIRCYNEKGELVWSHKETSATFLNFYHSFSPNRNFIILSIHYRPDTMELRIIARQIKFFNDQGKEVWSSIVDTVDVESGGELPVVADDGSFIIIDNGNALLKFFTPFGEKIKEIKMLKDENWQRTSGFQFSDNSEYVVAFFSEPGTPDTTVNDAAFGLFDKWGKELWRKEGRGIASIAIGPKSDFVLVFGERPSKELRQIGVALFNRDGKLMNYYPHARIFTEAIPFPISAKGYYALFNYYQDSAFRLIDTRNGKTLWWKPVATKPLSAAIFNNGACLISTRDGNQSRLYLLNRKGEIVGQYIYPDSQFLLKQKENRLFGLMRDNNWILELQMDLNRVDTGCEK